MTGGAVATIVDEARGQPDGPTTVADPWWLRRLDVLALALVLLPFVVGVVALVVRVGDSYFPSSDWGAMEIHVQDVGRKDVLVGLWSRGEWSHPGPLLFYLLAPFYWLTGGASIGLAIGALAINAATVTGMALVARRHGGTPLLLCVLIGCALVIRTFGAGFMSDPWIVFVTALPFGLLLMLVWSMTCGEVWALPAAAGVATFLAQTHVGFIVLALPLFAVGAGWLGVTAWRSRSETVRRRRATRAGLAAAGLLVLLWLPPVVDAVSNSPSNARLVANYFTHPPPGPEGEGHSVAEGWDVISSQFGLPPEWLTTRATPVGLAESPFFYDPRPPVLLLLFAIAAVLAWRQRQMAAQRLVITVLLAVAIGVFAIMRTLGAVYNYRFGWTWMPPLVAFAVTTWVGWTTLSRKWSSAERRVLVPAALAALTILGAINTAAALQAVTPRGPDSEVLAALTPDVVEALQDLDDRGGEVELAELPPGMVTGLYVRGLIPQLERHGIDTVVPAGRIDRAPSTHFSDGAPDTRLYFAVDSQVEAQRRAPDRRLLAVWTALPADSYQRLTARLAELNADRSAGLLDNEQFDEQVAELERELHGDNVGNVYAAAVFLDESL